LPVERSRSIDYYSHGVNIRGRESTKSCARIVDSSLHDQQLSEMASLLYSSAVFLNRRNVPQYGDLEALVNVRLLYISVDGLHYGLSGQVIVTVNPFASLPNLTDQELHLATETQLDRMRLLLLH
jgi:hypothetical protein